MADKVPDDLPPLPESGSSPPLGHADPAAPGPYVLEPSSPPAAASPSAPLPAPPPPVPPIGRPGGATPWWGRAWVLGTFAATAAMVLVVAAVVMVVAVQSDDDGDVARAAGDRLTTRDDTGGVRGSTTTEVGVVTTTTTPSITTTIAPPFPGSDRSVQQVGVDIQPGRYVTREVGFTCYWERVSGFGGTLDEVIANDNVEGSQGIVEILPSDAGFTSSGCGRWVAYSPPAAPATSFDNGDWSVGEDVRPGTYRSDGGPFCWWERMSGFTHGLDDGPIDFGTASGSVTVTIAAGERFTSRGCGPWTPA